MPAVWHFNIVIFPMHHAGEYGLCGLCRASTTNEHLRKRPCVSVTIGFNKKSSAAAPADVAAATNNNSNISSSSSSNRQQQQFQQQQHHQHQHQPIFVVCFPLPNSKVGINRRRKKTTNLTFPTDLLLCSRASPPSPSPRQ